MKRGENNKHYCLVRKEGDDETLSESLIKTGGKKLGKGHREPAGKTRGRSRTDES